MNLLEAGFQSPDGGGNYCTWRLDERTSANFRTAGRTVKVDGPYM